MIKKRIIFIEPSGSESNVFENFMNLPLTGSLYLGTILHNLGHTVRIFHEGIARKAFDPFVNEADVYCISSLTVNSNRARLLAGRIRHVYPQAKILIGGIHAALVRSDFIDCADHVVSGEAEGIIEALVEGTFTEKCVDGSPVEDLNELPFINYSLLEGYQNINIIPVMTSRGCPFDCNFCTVTKVFGKRFRMQSAERVVAEVKNALTYFKTRTIFFYDDNFTAHRERITKICEMFRDEKMNIYWTAQVRSDIARDPELLQLMYDSGCRLFYIGFESINDATLKAFHKSQTRKDIENAIAEIHAVGIDIHGMFIFGEDNDTVASLRDTADFAIKQNIDTVQFMVLTPFPGTQLFEKLNNEHRIYHTNWDYFNGMYAVYQPRTMSAAQLQQEALAAYQKFYSLRRNVLALLNLGFTLFLDALVWEFRRAMRYSFELMLLKSGANFLVRKYAATFSTYMKFLSAREAAHVAGNRPSVAGMQSIEKTVV
jgi:radical SAM superfamily enzyme YgiQ (UPF0313 family)